MINNNTLYEWMKTVMVQFPQILFRYHYNGDTKTHYIGVYPQSCVDTNEEYCQAENDIFFALAKEVPNDVFLFGTEETLFKLPSDAIEVSAYVQQTVKRDSTTILVGDQDMCWTIFGGDYFNAA